MSVNKTLRKKDKFFLTLMTLAWALLLASIGEHFLGKGLGEIVGLVCSISVTFANIYIYKKLIAES